MKIYELTPLQVVRMPRPFESGIIYISKKFNLCIHLCACGCGEQTVTPIRPEDGWTISGDDNTVTLRPSILNSWCNSHYYITNNKIEWL